MLAQWPSEHRLRFLRRVHHSVFYTTFQLRDHETMLQWGLI